MRAVTGHRLGPEITFAATAGVLTLVATRKGSLCAHAHTHLSNHSLFVVSHRPLLRLLVLRLPFRLALLSGGITTAALLPPYEKVSDLSLSLSGRSPLSPRS
jgi:hypothetical protein